VDLGDIIDILSAEFPFFCSYFLGSIIWRFLCHVNKTDFMACFIALKHPIHSQ